MISAGKPKSHSAEWLFCIVLGCLLTGCADGVQLERLSGATMGTTWNVSYVPTTEDRSRGALQAGIQRELDRVVQSMSTYLSDSEITRFNALPENTWFEVSNEFYSVLSTAMVVGRQSRGAYDVTIGPLVDLWGFGPASRADLPPGQQEIDDLLSSVGQRHLRLDGEGVRVSKQTRLALDFSSLAKGYAVDKVALWLQEQGIYRYLVEVGGEMRVSGLSHRGDNWHVAIEQPDFSTRSAAATISITDSSVATSGDYRNFVELEGKRYSHSIDPRTGWPIRHDLVSVTVIHPSAMLADAWATALIVLGGEEAEAVAQEQGLAVYFIRRKGDSLEHSYTVEFSPYLAVQD